MPAAATFCSASLSSTTSPALTTSYAVRPAYLDGDGVAAATAMDVGKQGVGGAPTQAFFAAVTQTAPGTMTGITLKVQISYTGTEPTTVPSAHWTDILTTNVADGTTAIEHSITGIDGATVRAAYGTESGRNAPYLRVCVKSIGANAATGESAVVYTVAS